MGQIIAKTMVYNQLKHMDLKDLLISQIEELGSIRFSNSFGWICIYRENNLFGGIKEIDNNILLLFLILSPTGFNNSLDDGFEKFDFGKTWSQTEITQENDIERVFAYVRNAYEFAKERRKLKKLKLKN
ncbi:MAG: hypothetical protein HY344_01170 [Candidatus Levybacteria bacterium]|nr:hypothetical protein [Candidatus Levybacteria bacterium]